MTSGSRGWKGVWYVVLAVTLSAPRVLPWKPLRVVITEVSPWARASFRAASVASAPELTKWT